MAGRRELSTSSFLGPSMHESLLPDHSSFSIVAFQRLIHFSVFPPENLENRIEESRRYHFEKTDNYVVVQWASPPNNVRLFRTAEEFMNSRKKGDHSPSQTDLSQGRLYQLLDISVEAE
ncbi:hypothetical protein NPIL_57431 [Nephila pilipes]|uniref:Uncharacterized protein n=1 Tax=Nephila pilipes TaxID=299642 RepID=A0A8X6NFD6_NEPPI|nr:hypothetical protein NPIL_57431 [Nephila pilipes]